MTKVKLPNSSNQSLFGVSPVIKIIVVSLLLVGGIAGALVFFTDSHDPKQAQIRSPTTTTSSGNGGNVSSTPIVDALDEPAAEGTRRYEMILAQLVPKAEGGSATIMKGTVIVETYDAWAPIGAEHFHKAVTSDDKFYDECRFFRVVDNFIVQFGINGNPQVQKNWRKDVLKDDPVVETNAYGTLTYATSGPNTRTTQLFINTSKKGNKFLDGQGFAPFGKVVKGMEFVEQINNEYKEKPNQGAIQNRGNEYLNKEFPRLSYIESVRLLE